MFQPFDKLQIVTIQHILNGTSSTAGAFLVETIDRGVSHTARVYCSFPVGSIGLASLATVTNYTANLLFYSLRSSPDRVEGIEKKAHYSIFIDLDLIKYAGAHHFDEIVSAERACSDHFSGAIVYVQQRKSFAGLRIARHDADNLVDLIKP